MWRSEPDFLGIDTYDVATQRVTSHHFTFGPDGETTVFRSPHRYAWPSELDLMAQLAGLHLETRDADWSSSPFTGECASHVSVYRAEP